MTSRNALRTALVAILIALAVAAAGCMSRRAPKEPEMPPVPPGPMPSKNYLEDLGEGMKMDMVWIPGGTFMMGSAMSPKELATQYPAGGANPADFENELPRHEVTVKGFWISRYEVTSDQYKRVVRRAPKVRKEMRDPMDYLLYLDVSVFCETLSDATERRYRLPTEAEWEYACRAGSPGMFPFGDPTPEALDKYMWYKGNSEGRTHKVGTSYANPWGLFDMNGNVSEWTVSMYKPYPYKADDGRNSTEEHGDRVVRGGSFRDPWPACRSTIRRHGMDRAGFRVVCQSWARE